MFGLSEKYEQLWRAIIRPPRAKYAVENLGIKISKQEKKFLSDQGLRFKELILKLSIKKD